jgi:hypothetical protein
MSNVVVSEQAVSSRGGIGHLELDTDPVGAHLAPRQVSANSIQVELVAIDELVEAGSIRPPRLIKLDVEGAENDAIEGMLRTITRSLPVVVCELHGTRDAFEGKMNALGYDVRLLEDTVVHDNPHALAVARSPSEQVSPTP